MYSDQLGLKASYSNTEQLGDVNWKDDKFEITLGNSILTKSMKFMVKQLLESIKKGKYDNRFCTLKDEATNLELFEKYKKFN